MKNIKSQKTDEELKQLARDRVNGLLFTDRDILPNEAKQLLGMVFMPLLLADDKTRQKLAKKDPGMFYEYTAKAGPRAINGYPIFWSVKFLTWEETKKFFDYVDKLNKAQETALAAA